MRKNKQKNSAISSTTNKYDVRLKTATSRSTHTNKSSNVRNRQLEAEVKLSHTLIQTKNQSDYELTIKIGEVNDICKQLKNQYSYLIDASVLVISLRKDRPKLQKSTRNQGNKEL